MGSCNTISSCFGSSSHTVCMADVLHQKSKAVAAAELMCGVSRTWPPMRSLAALLQPLKTAAAATTEDSHWAEVLVEPMRPGLTDAPSDQPAAVAGHCLLRNNAMDSFKQSTLYSFLLMLLTLQDLPQVLEDKYGGFLSSKVQDDFLYYADTLFKHLGDIVDQWMTFNEVISICELGYQLDVFAPQANKGLGAKYTCGHNVLLAHAKTMQLYRWVNLR
eukprot:GHRQ01034661.1.p1 GENE.GHRQ01034661.1~~GHRQ01034661.1.p1  ORF type:complete len:218 (+),score=63.06 GHRQ01034661.1:162-815(+)